MGGAVVSMDYACLRKWPVVPGVRVEARQLSSLEVAARTLHPRCQVLVGLLALLPPMVFSHVALS